MGNLLGKENSIEKDSVDTKDTKDTVEQEKVDIVITRYKTQNELYLEDRTKYNDYQHGIYKGIKWETFRNPYLKIWCGSLDKSLIITKKVDKVFPYNNIVDNCFDCGHPGDYIPSERNIYSENKLKYRDFPYVKDTLYRIIDCLVSN